MVRPFNAVYLAFPNTEEEIIKTAIDTALPRLPKRANSLEAIIDAVSEVLESIRVAEQETICQNAIETSHTIQSMADWKRDQEIQRQQKQANEALAVISLRAKIQRITAKYANKGQTK